LFPAHTIIRTRAGFGRNPVVGINCLDQPLLRRELGLNIAWKYSLATRMLLCRG
jgi:hypothetical protein